NKQRETRQQPKDREEDQYVVDGQRQRSPPEAGNRPQAPVTLVCDYSHLQLLARTLSSSTLSERPNTALIPRDPTPMQHPAQAGGRLSRLRRREGPLSSIPSAR